MLGSATTSVIKSVVMPPSPTNGFDNFLMDSLVQHTSTQTTKTTSRVISKKNGVVGNTTPDKNKSSNSNKSQYNSRESSILSSLSSTSIKIIDNKESEKMPSQHNRSPKSPFSTLTSSSSLDRPAKKSKVKLVEIAKPQKQNVFDNSNISLSSGSNLTLNSFDRDRFVRSSEHMGLNSMDSSSKHCSNTDLIDLYAEIEKELELKDLLPSADARPQRKCCFAQDTKEDQKTIEEEIEDAKQRRAQFEAFQMKKAMCDREENTAASSIKSWGHTTVESISTSEGSSKKSKASTSSSKDNYFPMFVAKSNMSSNSSSGSAVRDIRSYFTDNDFQPSPNFKLEDLLDK